MTSPETKKVTLSAMFDTETYLEPNRTSKMEKIVNGFYTPGKRQKRVNV